LRYFPFTNGEQRMKITLVIAFLAFACSGCAVQTPHFPNDAPANTTASYDYKGDITRDGGTDCWYYCR
jgi:PBP1b-binding outer membrane lipoprotein LpoB